MDRQDCKNGIGGVNSSLIQKKLETHAFPGSVVDPSDQQPFLVKNAQTGAPYEITVLRLISALLPVLLHRLPFAGAQ
jgi:hypothetical protein